MKEVEEIKKRVDENRDNIINFLREICAIPSMDGQLKDVGDRIQSEMQNLGFDDTRFDKMGNTVGRIGDGEKVIVFDSHIDTVGVGDPGEWEWDPFKGKVRRRTPVCARSMRRERVYAGNGLWSGNGA